MNVIEPTDLAKAIEALLARYLGSHQFSMALTSHTTGGEDFEVDYADTMSPMTGTVGVEVGLKDQSGSGRRESFRVSIERVEPAGTSPEQVRVPAMAIAV